MIKCCIFDLDGTLFNTLPTITHYVNETLIKHGIAPITEHECRTFIGHGAWHLIEAALASRGVIGEERVRSILCEYNAAYNSDTLYLTALYDGVAELVAELHRRGIALAILSNKPDPTVKDIVSKFFDTQFTLVRGARDGTPLKPNPTALLDMAGELGISMAEIAYIGDTGIDVATGRAAGAGKSIGVSWGFREREELVAAGADAIADEPRAVLTEVLR